MFVINESYQTLMKLLIFSLLFVPFSVKFHENPSSKMILIVSDQITVYKNIVIGYYRSQLIILAESASHEEFILYLKL